MAEPDEPTRRIDPPPAEEPTRVIPAGPEHTTRIDPAASGAPAQPPTGWTPPPLGQQWPPTQPQAWQAPQAYGSGQPGWPGWQAPPSQGRSGSPQAPGHPAAGNGQYGNGQYGYGQPGQYPGSAPYSQGSYGPYGQQSSGYYAQNGYPQTGYGQNGYPQTGYGQTGYGQYGYGQPGQYPQAPYALGQQPWQPPSPTRPKRSRGAAILAVTLAVAVALVGFAWAAPSLFERSLGRNTPGSGPRQPGQPTIAPDPQQTTEPGSEPAPGGGAPASMSDGVVFVEGETSNGTAAGTGMVLTADGKVLTNYHVVAGSEALQVTIADSGDTYEATVLGFDQTKDVALLQLKDANGLATVTIDDDEVQVGDTVTAVGNARGEGELVEAAGEVVDLDESLTVSSDSPWGSEEDLEGVIETTAGAVPGHSGGPMFDAESEVMGMTTAGSTEARRSYAVPIDEALEVVGTIEAGRDAGTVRVGPAGYLGVLVGETGRNGATITEVVAGGPADQAGVTVGSILTAVGDTDIRRDTNLATVIRSLEPGEQVTITWITPEGQQKQAQATLGASPVN